MSDIEKVQCLIIGSGPAGYTAAIYAARANLSPVLYTGMEMGGQLTQTTEVENFPGYPKGIMGPAMMDEFRQQAENMGTDIRFGVATKVDFSGTLHKVWIDDTKEIHAESVILATGATAKRLGLESEQRLNGKGVSACAVCDGFFYRGKPVSIVGGGDTACEDALYLANLCPEVHMLVRRDELRASKVMQSRVLKNERIKIYWNTEAEEVLGDDEVEGLRIKNNKTNETQILTISGFFVAIGHTPNSSIFKPFIDTNNQGYVITKPKSTETNVKGVFACGDLQDDKYRQAVSAAGTGCMAALDAERYLGVLHEG
ncbi:MAG: thioredoxin-disulfide reductase [Chitinophagales bacterium]|nr:thioredoxin-disulfide reductase [Chitinophagales bacterium]